MHALSTQAVRFVIVGLVSNMALYLAYLLLTDLWLGPKTAMSVLFAVGTLQTFAFNKRWTFSHSGKALQSFIRYGAAYGGCYLLNLAALYAFVDHLGWPHLAVQAAAMAINAVILFSLQRWWIFRPQTPSFHAT